MNVIHARCAGLDLGKDMLVAAVRLQDGERFEVSVASSRRRAVSFSSFLRGS